MQLIKLNIMEKLTMEKFKEIAPGMIFATGVLPNSPDGIFMTNTGGNLRWVAVTGYADDWAIYCLWDNYDTEWIRAHGDKVHNENNIRKCVPCDDPVLNHYRH